MFARIGQWRTSQQEVPSQGMSILCVIDSCQRLTLSFIQAMFLAATEGIILPPDKYSPEFTDFLGKCLQIEQSKRITASELLKVSLFSLVLNVYLFPLFFQNFNLLSIASIFE